MAVRGRSGDGRWGWWGRLRVKGWDGMGLGPEGRAGEEIGFLWSRLCWAWPQCGERHRPWGALVEVTCAPVQASSPPSLQAAP